jgi:hypothetical protein
MKNETTATLLESGELQTTENIVFMLNTILSLFQRGLESESGSQFIGYGMQLLTLWRDGLDDGDTDTDLADEVIANIVMGKQ